MFLKCLVILSFLFAVVGCSKECDMNQASNKMLAFGKVQGRVISKGGDSGLAFSALLTQETTPVTELIAKQHYSEACNLADEIAKKHGIDLDAEMKDMITMEQLAKDGGKGSGNCSIADAAKKQMELHGLLQAEVDAGRRDSEVFRQFSEDTRPFAEYLSTNPSKACELIEQLKTKYKL